MYDMKFHFGIRPCRIVNKAWESDVQSGLSYTPAEMAGLTAQHRAVQMQAFEPFSVFDNLRADMPTPMDYKRGVDENDLWNAAGDTKDRLKQYADLQVLRHATANA